MQARATALQLPAQLWRGLKMCPPKNVLGGRSRPAVGLSGSLYRAKGSYQHPTGRWSAFAGQMGQIIARVTSFCMIFFDFGAIQKIELFRKCLRWGCSHPGPRPAAGYRP